MNEEENLDEYSSDYDINSILEQDDSILETIVDKTEGIVVEPKKIYIEDDLSDLPGSMEIFAISLTASFNTTFCIENILEYYPLTMKNISTIISKIKSRTIQTSKQKKSANIMVNSKKDSSESNNQDIFFNQITINMNIFLDYISNETKDINAKLFKNGSIQVTGLKSIAQCNITINKIIQILKGEHCIFINSEGKPCHYGTPETIPKIIRFLESDDIKISNIKINMINTKYQYSSKINRSQLYMRLRELKMKGNLSSNIRLKYQPDIHAPVHIIIDLGNKKPVTGFVFESGKILIMASKNRKNIIDAYMTITELLQENHEHVVKRNLFEIIANDPELCKLIDLEALSQVVDDL